MAKYQILPYGPICLTQADTPWRIYFFFGSILIFFIIPCFILIILYSLISKNLMKPAPGLVQTSSGSLKYRKKVILMLGTVVISFFILLLPFRVLTLVILFVPNDIFLYWYENNYNLFLSILYASRILIHLNSAINPILYNLMSSKFRNGFYKLFLINNRLWCEFLFCPNIQRKNTLTNSLVTTTTTNLTTSSVIKHQYSISSVHSTKSTKNLSVKVNGRRQKRQSAGAGKVNGAFEEAVGKMNQHRCNYCSNQVHVKIEDTDYDASDEFFAGALNRCEGSLRESCSSEGQDQEFVEIDTPIPSNTMISEKSTNSIPSGDSIAPKPTNTSNIGQISTNSIPLNNIRTPIAENVINNKRSVDILDEEYIINKLRLKDDTKPGLQDNKCPVCRMFNKFQTVNNSVVNNTAAPTSCQFPAKNLQWNAEQVEFYELCKKVDNLDEYRIVHPLETKEFQGALGEPLEVVENRRVLRVDEEKYPKNPHISDNVHNHNQVTGTTRIVESIDSDVRNDYTSEIVSDQIDSVTRKTVSRKNLLKRSSTYDLFVGKLCDVRNQTVMNFANEHTDTTESRDTKETVATRENHKKQDKCQKQKLLKHIKALSLENEYNVYELQENCNQIRNQQVSVYSAGYNNDRSQPNDQVLVSNTIENSKLLKEQYKDRTTPKVQFMANCTHMGIISKKNCKCDSEQSQPFPFCANDFNNYVNFEMIQRGCVEKYVHQNKMKNSVSLHTGVRNGENRNTTGSDGNHISWSQEKDLGRSHWCYKRNYSETCEMLNIRDKTDEPLATHNRIILDASFDSRIEPPPLNKIDIKKRSNSWKKESAEYYKPNTQHVHNTEHIQNIHAQSCYRCSNKRKLLRRKSFDLTTFADREKHQLKDWHAFEKSIQGVESRDLLARRKSCDFGLMSSNTQFEKNSLWQRKVSDGHLNYIGNKRTKRSWSNESILEKDLCSIFENPMTAHLQAEDTGERILDIRDGRLGTVMPVKDNINDLVYITNKRFESVNHFENESNEKKDLIDFRTKNNSTIKQNNMISLKPALGNRKHGNAMFARRSSVANIIQNQPNTTNCLNIDGRTYSTNMSMDSTKRKLHQSRSFQIDTRQDQMRFSGKYAKLQGEQEFGIQNTDKEPQHRVGKYVLKKRRSIHF
ncbi:hypothetical protein WDU94_002454 [Cyamophila willieti]